MVSIIVEAADVWDYHQKNKSKLGTTMEIIADNTDFGVVIYLSSDDGLPVVTVMADEYICYEEEIVSHKACQHIVQTIYDHYLTTEFFEDENESINSYTSSMLYIEDMIEEREQELDDAIVSLISTAIGDECYAAPNFDELCEDVKDHILEYIARKHGFAVRRPMFLEDEDGNDFFEEYPYEHMIFDDEDNPIYQKNK